MMVYKVQNSKGFDTSSGIDEFLVTYTFEDNEIYVDREFVADFEDYPFQISYGKRSAPFVRNGTDRFCYDLEQTFLDDYVGRLLVKEHGNIISISVSPIYETKVDKKSNYGYH